MTSPTDTTQLLQRREELLARLEKIQADYQAGLDPDSEERATQLENAEVLAEISRVTREELVQVERALKTLSE